MTAYLQQAQQLTGRSDPEDGALAKRVFNLTQDDATRAILGFACEAGVRRNKGRTGAKEAPDAIRRALAGLAAPKDFKPICDLGNVVVDDDALETGQSLLAVQIAKALPNHERIIVLGGGHETAFASYSGLRAAHPDAAIGIINLDAHLDLRNLGEAGASSGTPFNQIYHLNPEAFDYLCLGVADEANTQALFARARNWNVNIVSDKALNTDPYAAEAQIQAIASRSDIIYLTIDIDLMPHYQAPGVSAPAARGVSFSTVEIIIEQVLSACAKHNADLPLADIVEVSPPHDIDNMTAKSAAILALSLLNSSAHGD